MYARTTTIHGNPPSIDRAVAHLRDEVMPEVQQMEGCVGLSMLADRDTGRCIITTAWETREAMHATADRVRPLRQRITDILGGDSEVSEYEIAVLHRAHEAPEGACTRVTWTRIEPQRVDEVLDGYKMSLLPKLEEMHGFCSASLMVDRREGRGAGAVTFADRAALEGSRQQATTFREEFTRRMGVQVVDVAEFELVLAHLRVPETV
jgi:quinol monooxygenase YgiN